MLTLHLAFADLTALKGLHSAQIALIVSRPTKGSPASDLFHCQIPSVPWPCPALLTSQFPWLLLALPCPALLAPAQPGQNKHNSSHHSPAQLKDGTESIWARRSKYGEVVLAEQV